jgi:hypothetical protein
MIMRQMTVIIGKSAGKNSDRELGGVPVSYTRRMKPPKTASVPAKADAGRFDNAVSGPSASGREAGGDMRKIAVPLIVLGSGLASFGIFAFESYSGRWSGWNIVSRVEIATGVAIAILGAILRKDAN